MATAGGIGLEEPRELSGDVAMFFASARSAGLRTIRRFAEEEIVIPDGPFEGQRFRCARQPYTGLLFDAIDSGIWPRIVATGPTQSGKSLSAFVIPLLWHLFEIGETVICGLPDMDMAGDKWREDILPAIESSRYREMLPVRGGGSRGGRVESIQFLHGPTLKFMTGGGGDKSRAGFTARVLVVTETDGMDSAGKNSREADKITQLEGRTRAYGARKRIYLECTVSVEQGRTWREYQAGTCSRIILPCPHCRGWVAPEREDLHGWQEAENVLAARRVASFFCPACGESWSDGQRRAANEAARLIHDGQEILIDGQASGDAKDTDTLGFRWSAVNNLFVAAGDLGGDEWKGARARDRENAEKELRQFVWCLPALPARLEILSLSEEAICRRQGDTDEGQIPAGTTRVTLGADCGKRWLHWVLCAWQDDARGRVVGYGAEPVAWDSAGIELAVLEALRRLGTSFADKQPAGGTMQTGWRNIDQAWIDSKWSDSTRAVCQFCREQAAAGREPSGSERWRPAQGRGASQKRNAWEGRALESGAVIRHVGEGFHLKHSPTQQLHFADCDADYWKTSIHQRLTTPAGEAGAIDLYRAPILSHGEFARHLTAERQTEEFVPGKGNVIRWEKWRKQNHWLDCLYLAAAAASFCGIRLVGREDAPRRLDSASPAELLPAGQMEALSEMAGRYFS